MIDQPAHTVREWNARHPVGTPVVAYPGARPEDIPDAPRLDTRTRSRAEVLGGHTAVVWVEGHGACIDLNHVDPLGACLGCGLIDPDGVHDDTCEVAAEEHLPPFVPA